MHCFSADLHSGRRPRPHENDLLSVFDRGFVPATRCLRIDVLRRYEDINQNVQDEAPEDPMANMTFPHFVVSHRFVGEFPMIHLFSFRLSSFKK
jgi:hypothetical protein